MLLATFLLDPDAIALEQTLRGCPELELEAERIAAHSTRWTMPCVWASNVEFETLDNALSNDPSIERIIETDEFPDEKYYHLEWSDFVERRINSYIDKEGSILSARATAQGWRVRIRFVKREQFDVFREELRDRNVAFELLELTTPSSPRQSFGDLTPEQRDTLVAALEYGYFEVPREITSRELADHLDKSHQTVSGLLRRGTEKLVRSMLTTNRHG